MPDGRVREVYCRWIGHRSYNGKMLFHYYNSDALANEITLYGAISSLKESVDESDIYFFSRNDPIQFEMYDSFKDWLERGKGEGYAYIFRRGAWYDATDSRPLKLTAKNVEYDYDY